MLGTLQTKCHAQCLPTPPLFLLKQESQCIAQAGFKLMILLPQSPEYWNYRSMPPDLASNHFFKIPTIKPAWWAILLKDALGQQGKVTDFWAETARETKARGQLMPIPHLFTHSFCFHSKTGIELRDTELSQGQILWFCSWDAKKSESLTQSSKMVAARSWKKGGQGVSWLSFQFAVMKSSGNGQWWRLTMMQMCHWAEQWFTLVIPALWEVFRRFRSSRPVSAS